jgi:large repetitive protein
VSTGAITTTEPTSAGSFTVVLATRPAGNVTVSLSAPPAAEGAMSLSGLGTSGATITFAPADWSTERTVTITPVDDPVQELPVSYAIQLTAASTVDTKYPGRTASVQVTNNDNDVAGLDITSVPSMCTTTAATSVAFSVKLRTLPADDVTVNLSVSDATMGGVTIPALVFAPGQWNVPQMFDVNGGAVTGDYMVIADPSSVGDSHYNAITSWGGTCSNGP